MELKLTKIYKQLLKEQMPGAPIPIVPPMGPGMMGSGVGMGIPPPMPGMGSPQPEGKNVIELKEVNTTISLFPMENRLVFTPQDHSSLTEKLKLYVDVLRQNFMIDKVNHYDEGVFEMIFDPRENFQSVVQFLAPQGPNVQQG